MHSRQVLIIVLGSLLLCSHLPLKFINPCHAEKIKMPESEFSQETHLMTFIHQDLWYGNSVSSSHQKVNLATPSSAPSAEGMIKSRRDIPISNCLREEWVLVNVSSYRGGLKSQGVMISAAPFFFFCRGGGNREGYGHIWLICWNAGSTFRPLYKRISLLSLLLFLRDSHLSSFPIFQSYLQFQSSNC